MAVASQPRLAIRPTLLTYTAEDESSLAQQLRAADEATQLVTISHERDVMLAEDGSVRRNYRYSTLAIKQLCLLLSPGLTHVLETICGNRVRDDESPDHGYAVQLLNDLLRLKFRTRLAGKVLVIDRRCGSIDGIVSDRYERFSNYALYQHAKQLAERRRPLAPFHEGLLFGRRLLLRFAFEEPLFELSVEPFVDTFRDGFHFANSEVGDCAVRASTLIIREFCNNTAVDGVRGISLRHVRGPKFEQGLSRLLTQVNQSTGGGSTLKQNFLQLLGCKLGLGQGHEKDEHRKTALADQLHSAGLGKRQAVETVTIAAHAGSHTVLGRTARLPLRTDPTWLAQRSAYDVFNALTYTAKSQSLGHRETAEQLAYQLLLHKFKLR